MSYAGLQTQLNLAAFAPGIIGGGGPGAGSYGGGSAAGGLIAIQVIAGVAFGINAASQSQVGNSSRQDQFTEFFGRVKDSLEDNATADVLNTTQQAEEAERAVGSIRTAFAEKSGQSVGGVTSTVAGQSARNTAAIHAGTRQQERSLYQQLTDAENRLNSEMTAPWWEFTKGAMQGFDIAGGLISAVSAFKSAVSIGETFDTRVAAALDGAALFVKAAESATGTIGAVYERERTAFNVLTEQQRSMLQRIELIEGADRAASDAIQQNRNFGKMIGTPTFKSRSGGTSPDSGFSNTRGRGPLYGGF